MPKKIKIIIARAYYVMFYYVYKSIIKWVSRLDAFSTYL